jgi:hypothetical protein
MKHAIALLLAATVLCGVAQAQTLDEIDKREAAVLEAWNATPLTVRRAIFVDGHPEGFGQYVERANNVFRAGEKLVTYAEPVGYGWKDIGGGLYQFGFKVDFLVKTANGKVIGGQEDFADIALKSHARNREFDVLLNLNLSDIEPGDYVIEYKLRDIASSKIVSISQPFKIVE